MKLKLLFLLLNLVILQISYAANIHNTPNSIQQKLSHLEAKYRGRVGIYAIDTNNNQVIAYRANQRFPVQSTMKLIGVAALLKQSESNANLLQEKIYYTKNDLKIHWNPVTSQHLKSGMTLEELSSAAISYSDNGAMNLILKKFGGPEFATNFAHSIGNKTFNAEHYEGYLNSNPNNNQDTSTPQDMAFSVQTLTLGDALSKPHQTQLITWMKDNTTGYTRIRAGVPIGWTVADKTGSGDYGVANDIGIAWSPSCKPIVIAIYTIHNNKHATIKNDMIADATSIIFKEFAQHDKCFNALFN